MDRRYGRGVVAAIVALVAAIALTAPVAARPSAPASVAGRSVRAVTGACQAVGGGPSTPAGPQRATVVIDTGTGPVWSACVSFSGTISGTEALARAQSVITDLNPVYDLYAGEGRAVCRLRGVGTDPPDCLGKSVDYWSYFRNGVYARGGAGTSTVHDGDTEGWRFGHGRVGPRAASLGTQAVAAPPPAPTTPPRATTATTRPPAGGGSGGSGGGNTGAGAGPGAPPDPGQAPAPGGPLPAPPGSPDGSGGPVASTSTAVVDVEDGAVSGHEVDEADRHGDQEGAAAAVAGSSGGDGSGGGSGTGGGAGGATSALGFAAVLAAIGAAAVVVHRRRTQALAPTP